MKPYHATIEGVEEIVEGWDKDGNLLLANRRAFEFKSLEPPAFDVTCRRLLRVEILDYHNGGWGVDGESLDAWIRAEVAVAEAKRNRLRGEKGLPPVPWIATDVVLSMEDFYHGKFAPDPTAPERRLDAAPNLLARLVLCGLLHKENERKRDPSELVAVAWLECADHSAIKNLVDFDCPGGSVVSAVPLLLRSFREIKPNSAVTEQIVELDRVADRLITSAREVAKATRIADLYSAPSYRDAETAAVKQNVPKEFVAYTFTELHARAFPSSGQAARALKTLPLLRGLDTGCDMRTTAWRWLSIVRKELEKRNLVEPRSKGPAAKRIRDYDVEHHPAPAPTVDEDERQKESSGSTKRDTRQQELPDEQGFE